MGQHADGMAHRLCGSVWAKATSHDAHRLAPQATPPAPPPPPAGAQPDGRVVQLQLPYIRDQGAHGAQDGGQRCVDGIRRRQSVFLQPPGQQSIKAPAQTNGAVQRRGAMQHGSPQRPISPLRTPWHRHFPSGTHQGFASPAGEGAVKQRILSYRTPPCHRRPVMAHECCAALQHFQTSAEWGRGIGGGRAFWRDPPPKAQPTPPPQSPTPPPPKPNPPPQSPTHPPKTNPNMISSREK